MSKRALVVITSHEELGDTEKKTGYWLGEVAHFYIELKKIGVEMDFVSPKGGNPPMDPKSDTAMDGSSRRLLKNDPEFKRKLENTVTPDQINPDDYDAIYYAGGHGTVWDFPDNERLAKIAAQIYQNGKIVSAVCHGPTGLLNIKLSDGSYLIEGKEVTGFTNTEEKLVRLSDVVPFLLEDELKKRGATYKKRLPFIPYAIVSDRLVTGQNPYSTRAVAKRVARLLS